MVRLVWVGGVLFLASAGCSALSLGQVQGQALIGRKLDLTVPLTLADGESGSSLCLEPKVSFGDDRLPAAAVQAEAVAGATGNQMLVRVQTTKPVNEPFLTLDLTVGCAQRSTRSYVLLADLQPIESLSAPTVSPAPVVSTAAAPKVVTSPAAANPAAAGVAGPKAALTAAGDARRPIPNAAPKPVVQKRPAADMAPVVRAAKPAVESVQGARLKLDPLELIAAVGNASPNLRLSVDVPSDIGSGTDIEQRRDAARLLWRSLSVTPEEAAAQTLRADMAAGDAQQLRAQMTAAQQAATEARAQLDEERDNWFLNPMVLALGGGLVLSLGALVAVVARQRRKDPMAHKPAKAEKPPKAPKKAKQPWWKKRTDAGDASADDSGHSLSSGRGGDEHGRLEPVSKALDIDVDTLFPDDSAFSSLSTSGAGTKRKGASGSHSDFMPSMLMDGGRSVATEELFDLQQQVEFFISLGQADQAIDVLVNHLSESHEPSPLAYLDLLKLYHELGQRENYENLRRDFNGKFNGGAPDFDHYSNSRRGLERYESALSRIQSLWSSPAVLDVIERSIFRHDGLDESAEMFDLEAYRELLLLYGIAREVLSTDEAGEPTSTLSAERKRKLAKQAATDFGPTTMQPLTAGTLETRLKDERQLEQTVAVAVGNADHESLDVHDQSLDMGSVGVDLDLDLDLTSGMGDLDAGDGSGQHHELDFHLDDFPESSPHQQPNSPSNVHLPMDAVMTPSAHVSGQLGLPAPEHMDLDLLNLDELDGLKIKKSGKAS